ncbi:MAG: mevalonate kinase [Aggregatilineales bacterium]
MALITASAPGKLMLFGEHAVVYNRPCIVTAVGLRIFSTVEEIETNNIEVETNGLHIISIDEILDPTHMQAKDVSFVLAAVASLFRKYGGIRTGIRIITKGPEQSYGLGSSSAVTVATIKALGDLFGLKLSLTDIFDLSYQAVLAVQGKASGFDVAAAVYGGTIYYLTGGKRVEPLNVETLPVIIGYSGQKVSTIGYINVVQSLIQRLPWAVNPIFDLIGEIVESAKRYMLVGDWQAVGELANINQGLLESIGVNTDQLSKIIFAARGAGAWGAKLSGAGGGDCMFAICDNHTSDQVMNAMEQAGSKIISFKLNAEGVQLENN